VEVEGEVGGGDIIVKLWEEVCTGIDPEVRVMCLKGNMIS
jgi:hypothetical protein